MSTDFNAIVVGLGAMGSATCYQLASRGVKVLGLDQYGVPHAMGSSHGESRMIRMAYYEHPDYVPLLRRAYELWDEIENRAQHQLLYRTGGVFIGPAACEFVTGTINAAQQHGLAHEVLDRSELRERFPQFKVPDDHIGVFEPTAGFLLPERVVAAHIELALAYGAQINTYEPVLDWSADQSQVKVRTPRRTYTAEHIVFCGGAWSGQMLGDIGVQLKVTRQVLGWVWPRAPEKFALGTSPVWAIDNDDGSIHYGFPMLPGGAFGRPGFKIAHHFHGTPTSPDAINRTPQQDDEEDFRRTLKRYIPDADGPLLSMAICMYTNSPDSHFIIDRHPKHERAIIACGFSGHGFKFASVVGEVLADLALDGRSSQSIDFLRLSRFSHEA